MNIPPSSRGSRPAPGTQQTVDVVVVLRNPEMLEEAARNAVREAVAARAEQAGQAAAAEARGQAAAVLRPPLDSTGTGAAATRSRPGPSSSPFLPPIPNPREGIAPLVDLLLSSRVNLGGFSPSVSQFLPLVSGAVQGAAGGGGVAGALAGAGLASPAGIGAAALLAVEGLRRLAERAAAVTDEFSSLRTAIGGTNEETARLRAYGAGAGDAASLQQRLTSDPFAMAYGQRYGAVATPGPYGNVDWASNYLRVIEGVRREQGDEQIRAIRALGLRANDPLLRASEGTMWSLRTDAGIGAITHGSRQTEQNSADLIMQSQRLGSVFGDLATQLGRPFIQPFMGAMGLAADSLRGLSLAAEPAIRALEWASQFSLPAMYSRVKNQLAEREMGDHQSALDANTDAMREQTAALARLTQQIGGGPRANSGRAVPEGLIRGVDPQGRSNYHRALDMQALRFGDL